MGELHLDIVAERIRQEYKIDVDLGQLIISYREAPNDAARDKITFRRLITGKEYVVNLEVSVEPVEWLSQRSRPQFILSKAREDTEALEKLKWSTLKEIHRGLEGAMTAGPVLGCPVVNAKFTLHHIEAGRGTPSTLLSAAATEACRQVLVKAGTHLLEPVMALEVMAEPDMASEVQHDLITRRRGEVLSSEERGGVVVLRVLAPLASLRGYSTLLRAMTSGRASFGMHLHRYVSMDEREQNKAIEEVTGFSPLTA